MRSSYSKIISASVESKGNTHIDNAEDGDGDLAVHDDHDDDCDRDDNPHVFVRKELLITGNQLIMNRKMFTIILNVQMNNMMTMLKRIREMLICS